MSACTGLINERTVFGHISQALLFGRVAHIDISSREDELDRSEAYSIRIAEIDVVMKGVL